MKRLKVWESGLLPKRRGRKLDNLFPPQGHLVENHYILLLLKLKIVHAYKTLFGEIYTLWGSKEL